MATVKFLMKLPPTNYHLRILKKKMKYIIDDFILSVSIDPYTTFLSYCNQLSF